MQAGCAREQVESLKNEADFHVAYAREFVVFHRGDELAVDPIFALRGCVQAADQIHQS